MSQLELLVLGAVAGLSEAPYGLVVRQEIAECTGREIAIGSVYRSLAGLERKGLVRSRRGEPTSVRGGRAKRFFTLTPAGKRALRQAVRDLRSLARDFDLGLASP